jgi:hypothetical protein
MNDVEYGLRRRATEISTERKRRECEQKAERTMAVAGAMTLGMVAGLEESDDEFEPQPRPDGLRGVVFDVKQWISGVVSRD